MLDIGWSELLVIAVVAIIVVGPKDLPRLLRTVGGIIRKVRATASDFRAQFDEVIEQSEVKELKKTVDDMTGLTSNPDYDPPYPDFDPDNLSDDLKPLDAYVEEGDAQPRATSSASAHKADDKKQGHIAANASASRGEQSGDLHILKPEPNASAAEGEESQSDHAQSDRPQDNYQSQKSGT